jgi:hypothetical protein
MIHKICTVTTTIRGQMADLGDLSGFLKSASVADLDWLDVDEKSYRELDRLPQQNLDFAPQLEEAWSHVDGPAAHLVPNKGATPSMRDVAESKTASGASATIIRVARMLIMQNPDARQMIDKLKAKFGAAALRTVRDDLVKVASERGLLGGYYIDASDFPGCHQMSKDTAIFLRRYASQARFVIACKECAGCEHVASSACAVFQKQIVVDDVPYTPELAAVVERIQTARGKSIQASGSSPTPRERIQRALLAGAVSVGTTESVKPVVNPSQFLRQAEAPKKLHLPVLGTEQRRVAEAEMAWAPTTAEGKVASVKVAQDKVALGVVQTLRKEMLKGRSEREILSALKLSFSTEELRATRERWEPLFKEAGLYGTIYSTQDSFDDCHEGSAFLARQASSVKAIVAGGKCSGCTHNKMGRCQLYGRPLVAKAQDLYTPEMLTQTLREHRHSGRVASTEPATTVRETLKQVYRTASNKTDSAPITSYMQAFTGSTVRYVTSGLVKRDIVKTAAKYMNEGLYGMDLLSALKSRFGTRDIKAAQDDLRPVIAEQGLQGVFYVDASVYGDYGKGCDEGSRLHRTRLVPYVKTASKCESCVFQTKVGYCSKYNKALVAEPPYTDKLAQQREILASGNSTDVSVASLVNESLRHNIRAQFELQNEMRVDVNPVTASSVTDVEIGNAKVKL